MKITLLVIELVLISALFIVSNQDLRLQNAADRAVFGNLYYNWMGLMFNNGKTIVGNVVNLQWLPPTNQSIQNSQINELINSSNASGSSNLSVTR